MIKQLKSLFLSELSKGGTIVFLFRIIGVGLFFAINIYISNKYGAASLGSYTFFLLMINIIAIITILGLDQFALQQLPKLFKDNAKSEIIRFNNKVQDILFNSIIAVLILTLGIYFLKVGIFDDPMILLILIICIGPSVIYRFRLEGIRATKNMGYYGFLGFTALPLFMFLGIFVFDYYGFNAIFLAYASAIIITTIIAQFVWKKKIQSIKLDNHNHIDLNSILKKSTPLMLIVALMFMNEWIDKLMLRLLTSNKDLGLYTSAFRLVQFFALPLISINAIAAPRIAEKFQNNAMLLKDEVQQTTSLIIITSIPLALLLFLFPDFFLGIFGKEFSSAKSCLMILLLAQCINVFAGPVGIFLKMTENQNALLRIVFVSFMINLILNLFLIPKYGIEGSAISTAISIGLINILAIVYIKNKFNFYSFAAKINFNKSSNAAE